MSTNAARAARRGEEPPLMPHPLFFEAKKDGELPAVVEILVRKAKPGSTKPVTLRRVRAEDLIDEQQLRDIGGGGEYELVARDGLGNFAGTAYVTIEGPPLPFPGDVGLEQVAPAPAGHAPAPHDPIQKYVGIATAIAGIVTPIVTLALTRADKREDRERADRLAAEQREAQRREEDRRFQLELEQRRREDQQAMQATLQALANRPAPQAPNTGDLMAQVKGAIDFAAAVKGLGGPAEQGFWEGLQGTAAAIAPAIGPPLERIADAVARQHGAPPVPPPQQPLDARPFVEAAEAEPPPPQQVYQ